MNIFPQVVFHILERQADNLFKALVLCQKQYCRYARRCTGNMGNWTWLSCEFVLPRLRGGDLFSAAAARGLSDLQACSKCGPNTQAETRKRLAPLFEGFRTAL